MYGAMRKSAEYSQWVYLETKFARPSGDESHTSRVFIRHGNRRTGFRLLLLATPFLLLLAAGCGAMSSPVGASAGSLVINADKARSIPLPRTS